MSVQQTERDPLASIAESREDVEEFAENRTDQLGAMARVLLDLEADELPSDADLAGAGLPTRAELGVREKR